MNSNTLKIILKRAVWIAAIAGMLLTPAPGAAYRYHGHDGGWGGSHYWGGHGGYYRWGFHGHWYGYNVFAPPIGAFLLDLPFECETFVIGGSPYYAYNGIYMRPYLNGYVVVEEPSVVSTTTAAVVEPAAPAAAAQTPPAGTSGSAGQSADKSQPAPAASTPASAGSAEKITINVPNSHGTFTPVVLTKKGNGYLGPQGEMYIGHPTVAQLKALYGN